MKPYYTKQILTKQLGIDIYSSQKIIDLLVEDEKYKWQTIFSNNVLSELIKYPKIKPIHNYIELYWWKYMSSEKVKKEYQISKKNNNPIFILDTVDFFPMMNIIIPNIIIDLKYFEFHTNISNITKYK